METNDIYLTSLTLTQMYLVTENKKYLERFSCFILILPRQLKFFSKFPVKHFIKKNWPDLHVIGYVCETQMLSAAKKSKESKHL